MISGFMLMLVLHHHSILVWNWMLSLFFYLNEFFLHKKNMSFCKTNLYSYCVSFHFYTISNFLQLLVTYILFHYVIYCLLICWAKWTHGYPEFRYFFFKMCLGISFFKELIFFNSIISDYVIKFFIWCNFNILMYFF